MKSLELAAGRELDALVAEKVMGLFVGRDPRNERDVVFKNGNDLPVNDWEDLPRYSTDISAAWEVVEKVLNMGHPCEYPSQVKTVFPCGFRLERETEGQMDCGKWFCQFPETTCVPPHEEMNAGVEALASTAPHAICLAALKVVVER